MKWYDLRDSRRHSLPFIRPKYHPPPAPLSFDDPPVTPEAKASFFSILFFNWISPMMALGSARPLQPTDLWKMDDARSSRLLADQLAASFDARVIQAKGFNDRLADPNSPLPLVQRLLYSMLPRRQQREHDFRTKHGKKKASLTWALNDVFGRNFWFGALFKIFGDLATAFSPLLIKALITFSTEWQTAEAIGRPAPNIGRGIGMAIGLFCLLACSSIGMHHFFKRKRHLRLSALISL